MRKLITIVTLLYCLPGACQVNLPTGSATFSLPIFQWQDDKSRLSSIVALNYNSQNGLKTDDVANDVGQGWSLLQGGVITRTQVGEPDDQKAYGSSDINDLTKYPNGFLYANGYSTYGDPNCPLLLTKYPIFKDRDHYYKQHNIVAEDREADYFNFTFNGRSGTFVFDKNSFNQDQTTCQGISLGDSKLKIWCSLRDMTGSPNYIRTTIDVIYIQDENGLIYTFSQHDITQLLKVQYCNSSLQAKYKQPNFKNGKVYYESSYPDPDIVNPNVINGWYLTQIEDPLTQRIITFTYNIEDIQANGGNAISYYSKNYSIVSHYLSYSKSPKISTINYPDGHVVSFNYGDNRIDMNGDKILSSIDVKYYQTPSTTRYLAKYILNTGYVMLNRFATPKTDYEKEFARLYLKSVQKLGIDLKGEDNPYKFDYYLGSSAPDDFVPPPFFYMKDIWGYYNGSENKAMDGSALDPTASLYTYSNRQLEGLCFRTNGSNDIVLNPKDGYSKNGLLKKITYPTGGSLSYAYAQNTYYDGSSNVMTGGVHVSSTTVNDGGTPTNCAGTATVTNYNYTLDDGTTSSLWGVETPLNSMTLSNHFSPVGKYFDFLSLSCKYHYQYPGIQSRDQATSLTVGQQILSIASTLASIYGDVTEVLDVIKLCSGTTGPGAVIIDAITTLLDIGITCFGNPDHDESLTIYYNSDLNSSNPLPKQFKEVQVVQNSGSSGKTVDKFTSVDDYPYWVPAGDNTSFSMKQRYPAWAYGLLKTETVYDASGLHPIRQTENIYDPQYQQEHIYIKGYADAVYCAKCLVTANASQKYFDWTSAATPDPNNPYWQLPTTSFGDGIYEYEANGTYEKMTVDNYLLYTGRLPLSETIEREYKPGSSTDYLQTSTEYQYNDNYLVSNITATQSNGDKQYKSISYTNDLLNTNNIIDIPTETATSFSKNNSSDVYYTGESFTEFTTVPTGNIVPSKTLVQRFASPVPAASMTFINPNYPNDPPYVTTQQFSYDQYGNLIGETDEGNHIVTNIYDYHEKYITVSNTYDYNDKYVTASVINANPNADPLAYTSFETSNMGGWQYTGQLSYNTSLAVTGTTSLNLSSSNTLSKDISSTKPYILSFWSTAPLTVSNATLKKTVNQINEFTYYEYIVPANTATVTISGNANVDELRLYPQDARMRTVTYDPLIGKTSECDENNRITYYEYDDLARLRFIKDENKNVVKMYEYNVKNQGSSASCPVTYYNLAVSEVFIKNDCDSNQGGDTVTYTIPESTYTSTISQEDVDQKVQDDLDQFGQSYANSHGSCKQIYYNAELSQTFTKEGCDSGYIGTTYTYTVPYGTYTSTLSQADADQQAQDDIDANGQATANWPGNASCVVDTSPEYIGEDDAPTQCEAVNGEEHRFILVTDENPNSSSYNQTQWADEGADASCPVTCGFVAATGFNIATSDMSTSGNTVSFYIVFNSQSGTTNWSSYNTVAHISGACLPSTNRFLDLTSGGDTWQVEITYYGDVIVHLLSGTPPSGQTWIGLTGGSYDL